MGIHGRLGVENDVMTVALGTPALDRFELLVFRAVKLSVLLVETGLRATDTVDERDTVSAVETPGHLRSHLITCDPIVNRDELVAAAGFFTSGAEDAVFVDVGARDRTHLLSFLAVLVGADTVDSTELNPVNDPRKGCTSTFGAGEDRRLGL